MLAAFVAVSMVAFVGCDKEDDGSNGGNGTEQPTPTPNPNPNPNPNPEPGPEPQPVPDGWVDLGLPSGLLWAECNVGATTPEGNGDYFAWGEIQSKSDYSWGTYQYCTVDGGGSVATLTKYNTSTTYGTPDNLTVLESGDDAAAAILGDGARTPTKAEWDELIGNTTVEWTTQNGVAGCRFTANGDTLFLPAAGFHVLTAPVGSVGTNGNYWSSSLDTDNPTDAHVFSFDANSQSMGTNYRRYYGRSVRAVRAR